VSQKKPKRKGKGVVSKKKPKKRKRMHAKKNKSIKRLKSPQSLPKEVVENHETVPDASVNRVPCESMDIDAEWNVSDFKDIKSPPLRGGQIAFRNRYERTLRLLDLLDN